MLTATQKLLESISDAQIFEEAAKRLQQQYFSEHAQKLLFGTFRFIFHDGLFQGVEDCPRYRRYESPSNSKKRSGRAL